jgi:prefoldin subunit 5
MIPHIRARRNEASMLRQEIADLHAEIAELRAYAGELEELASALVVGQRLSKRQSEIIRVLLSDD